MSLTQLVLAQGPAREGLTRTQALLADDPLWLILLKVVGCSRSAW
jgi:NADH-quinone oxidoreductase subunit H